MGIGAGIHDGGDRFADHAAAHHAADAGTGAVGGRRVTRASRTRRVTGRLLQAAARERIGGGSRVRRSGRRVAGFLGGLRRFRGCRLRWVLLVVAAHREFLLVSWSGRRELLCGEGDASGKIASAGRPTASRGARSDRTGISNVTERSAIEVTYCCRSSVCSNPTCHGHCGVKRGTPLPPEAVR